MFCSKLKFGKLFSQMERIGVNSLAITLVTGTFTGAVLAIQSYKGFRDLGGENFLGPIVALTMTRELGPVLTGLMVAGRAGSAIAAELGTMRITEQVDALQTLQFYDSPATTSALTYKTQVACSAASGSLKPS